MGVSSFTCAKTNLPIISFGDPRIGGRNLNDVVYYAGPDARAVRGRLSEYAVLHTAGGDIDLGAPQAGKAIEDGVGKLALAGYLAATDGYATLGRSHADPGQGGLTYAEGFVEEAVRAGGFATYEGLCQAFHNGVPVRLASRIGGDSVAVLKRVGDLAKAGYEEGFLSRIPGSPVAGIPGEIGKYSAIEVSPLDERCDRVALVLGFGDARKRVVVRRAGDDYEPDPAALGRDAAATMEGHVSERVATFERDGEVVGTVTVHETAKGRTTYVTDTGDGPSAFVQLHEALRQLGYDIPYPAALMDVDMRTYKFFYRYGEKPATGTFEAPTVHAPRP